jgi:hypothetical protein
MIRRIILKWLGISDFEKKIVELKKENEELRKAIMVGVDYHPRLPKSWAVICIEGKSDYVRFVELPTSQIREVAQFLRRYDERNCTIDMPHGIPKYLFFDH